MNYQNISEEQWTQWKKKRKTTLIGYLLVGIMVGIDYTFMFTTLYLYLDKMIKTDHPKLFYGIIVGAYSLSSTLFGVVCGRWVDRTRKIKLYTNVTLILQIIGCFLYVIHFNVVYPLIGRLIGGLGDPFPSVTSGEVIRIYDKEGSTRALWWLASVYSFGFMIGPVVILFFKNVDFYIWTIHITQLNVIAIFMAGLLLLTLVVSHFLIHDCSAEIDLKEYLQQQKNAQRSKENHENATEKTRLLASTDDTDDDSSTFKTIPISIILRKLLHNVDAVLMFITTFVFMYCLFAVDVLLPLLTVVLLDWSLTALTGILIGYSILYFILLMVMSKYCTGSKGVYVMSVVCIAATILMLVSMIGLKVFERNRTRDIVLMLVFVILYVFAWVIEEVIIRCMLAMMVPSHCQSFAESSRNAVSRSSTIVASVTAPLVLSFLEWWSTGLIFITFVILLVFIARRKQLCDIREIDFHVDVSEDIAI